MAFHWSEASDEAVAPVPAALTEALDAHRVAMRGTYARAPRCIALQGDVGAFNACTVYERRPSPCRELQPAWEHGAPSPQCDRARARHGLAPLRPDDWALPHQDASHIAHAAPAALPTAPENPAA
ncbi:hypothetical protein HNQ52_001156 [Chiayiivirga flava]|uniref:YkgJ family cysteine cluster protein n=1 Tax=Chiayiivirga flava TaxID=659595 RepID=A0A7W8D4Y5_9GAMM|nr:hypothetical protein [Chiayiivirga flava]